MSRLLLAALAALVVAVPVTAAGSPATQLEGTVGAKLSRGLIRVDARKMAHILRVPGTGADPCRPTRRAARCVAPATRQSLPGPGAERGPRSIGCSQRPSVKARCVE